VEEAAFSDDEHRGAVRGLADQLAIAIQNARLYKRESDPLLRSSRRARLLQALQKSVRT
jgi:GAF domain-containing protein